MSEETEPFVLHDMPTADGDWAVVALPMDTPGEVTEKIRAAVQAMRNPEIPRGH